MSDAFKATSPSVFGRQYLNEFTFGKSLFQNSIRPKLENAKVFLNKYLVSVFPPNRLVNLFPDRSWVLCLRCSVFKTRKPTRSTVHIRCCSSVHPEQLLLGCRVDGKYTSIAVQFYRNGRRKYIPFGNVGTEKWNNGRRFRRDSPSNDTWSALWPIVDGVYCGKQSR